METQQPEPRSRRGTSAGYKRASRKGAPPRYSCGYPGCDKIYSRAEHLQRHQLNHDPKEIFQCDVVGCDQKFVRADLLARHKKRHTTSYVPRNRAPSFASAVEETHLPSGPGVLPSPAMIGPRPIHAVPRDAAILLASSPGSDPSLPMPPRTSSSRVSHTPAWTTTVPDMSAVVNPVPRKSEYFHQPPPHLHEQSLAFASMQFAHEDLARTDNFGTWLFDPYNMPCSGTQLPFVEAGLESTFNSNIHYDNESQSLKSGRSQLETPPQLADGDELLRGYRRDEVLRYLDKFRQHYSGSEQLAAGLSIDATGDYFNLGLDNMRDCIREYWQYVAPRLPIVHQPSFNCNRGYICLLMVIIALGAASLRGHDATGQYSECGILADAIIEGVRWEIVTHEDASPPVTLPVAQSLLLLEFYEKMYSSRRFHVRAHINHAATLTLLRRGSPLIGRSGTDSPPEEHPTMHGNQGVPTDSRSQWIHWADTEAMHRVVFAAFMMDILHAAMFGHAADMAPHEIRLPLPCDDTLWTAPTPEAARQHESSLRMYGIRELPFLDGLKKALHGKPLRTASFGRMIIMSGLVSVGWHLSHREAHLKFLDLTAPSSESQEKWKLVVLRAYDKWKDDIDAVHGGEGSSTLTDQGSHGAGLNGPVQSASVLYHLAYICLYVDIVDCQLYAGAKHVLGRKVSARDRANAVSRMESWARLTTTRTAVLHAFRLLHHILVGPRCSNAGASAGGGDYVKQEHYPLAVGLRPIERQSYYSCRDERDPHNPWIMYYATLCIWSYVMAVRKGHKGQHHGHRAADIDAATHRFSAHQQHDHTTAASSLHCAARPPPVTHGRVVEYLTDISRLTDLEGSKAGMLADGLPDLLDTLHGVLAGAHSELLQEAHLRLRVCKEILLGSQG